MYFLAADSDDNSDDDDDVDLFGSDDEETKAAAEKIKQVIGRHRVCLALNIKLTDLDIWA